MGHQRPWLPGQARPNWDPQERAGKLAPFLSLVPALLCGLPVGRNCSVGVCVIMLSSPWHAHMCVRAHGHTLLPACRWCLYGTPAWVGGASVDIYLGDSLLSCPNLSQWLPRAPAPETSKGSSRA